MYTEWSINEKVAFEIALAASWTGLRAAVAMKQVGLNVASDPLFSAAYTGVRGGFIIIPADDPGPHSSQTEQDSRLMALVAEFDQIFSQGLRPSEPTLYVSITSKTTPQDAPSGCENWFVQINVPALSPAWDWQARALDYAALALDLLAQRGVDIRRKLVYQKLITPVDLQDWTGARRGALYGASSNNRWAAFRRPHNRCPDLSGLYFAGGTAHPGCGVPMVTLSDRVASQLLLNDEGK